MTPREFFNAWTGFDENQKNEWNALFWISKANAVRTAWSEKQARQALQDKAPWETDSETKKPGKKKPLSGKVICSMLDLISKSKDNGGSN